MKYANRRLLSIILSISYSFLIYCLSALFLLLLSLSLFRVPYDPSSSQQTVRILKTNYFKFCFLFFSNVAWECVRWSVCWWVPWTFDHKPQKSSKTMWKDAIYITVNCRISIFEIESKWIPRRYKRFFALYRWWGFQFFFSTAIQTKWNFIKLLLIVVENKKKLCDNFDILRWYWSKWSALLTFSSSLPSGFSSLLIILISVAFKVKCDIFRSFQLSLISYFFKIIWNAFVE